MTPDTEIVLIGAGLSGLALAEALVAEGREVTVLDARDRPGGRVLSERGLDLGPAWIWPHNHRMLALAQRLGAPVFAQHSAGRLVFEDAQGRIRRDLDMATMGGALRIGGGLARLTDALADSLGPRLRLAHTVREVQETASAVTVTGDGFKITAGRVVLALPPRLGACLGLDLPDVPTWMAGHAKLVAIYPTPFWRQAGFNGDAISHLGPLAEIHDASPMEGGAGALFGFAVPGAARAPGFPDAAVAQLVRLFGADAGQPVDVLVKDWSADPATATRADLSPPQHHPSYRPIPATPRILFAGTESAPEDGGFLEGALAAAEACHRQLATVSV